jgi:hypothetical protein
MKRGRAGGNIAAGLNLVQQEQDNDDDGFPQDSGALDHSVQHRAHFCRKLPTFVPLNAFAVSSMRSTASSRSRASARMSSRSIGVLKMRFAATNVFLAIDLVEHPAGTQEHRTSPDVRRMPTNARTSSYARSTISSSDGDLANMALASAENSSRSEYKADAGPSSPRPHVLQRNPTTKPGSDSRRIVGLISRRLLVFVSGTPYIGVWTSGVLSVTCPKNGDVPKSPFPYNNWQH